MTDRSNLESPVTVPDEDDLDWDEIIADIEADERSGAPSLSMEQFMDMMRQECEQRYGGPDQNL